MSDGMLKQVKKVGSRFAFEFFLEVWHDRLVEMLRKWLATIAVEDIRRMVRGGKFPDTSDLNLGAADDYLEYLEKISTERLFEEYLAPARPDLAQAIQELGMPGARWLVKLREHLLDQVRHRVPVKQDIVQATCDNCGKSWPVPRAEFASITECPFCHHPANEQANPQQPATSEEEE